MEKTDTIKHHTSRALALAALFGSIALFSSCSNRHQPVPEGNPVRIGFSLDSLVVERWQRDIEHFTKAAESLNAIVELEVANQDADTQAAQIRDLIKRKIHVLVVVPNDAEGLRTVLDEVKQQGIPLISYDRLARNSGVDLYISFDNEKVGALMAQSVLDRIGSGNVVIVNGAQTDNNSYFLNQGMHKVLDPAVKEGRIKIVGEIWPKNWDSDEVREKLEGILHKTSNINAVLSGNDMLAEAVINLLSENRLMNNILVTGQDADLAACQRIAEGTQFATVFKPIEVLAVRAAGLAVDLARGKAITPDQYIFDGSSKRPFISLEPILVTRETLDATVIKEGFHRREDVYRFVLR